MLRVVASARTQPTAGLLWRVATGTQGYATGASNVKEVKTDEEFSTLLKGVTDSGKLGIVDFTAKWCGPCRMIAPVYEKLSQKYPEAVFVKVDIDQPSVAQTVNDHSITGVPTFVYYKGGRKVEAFSGARPEMLEELIKKHVK